MRMMAYAVAGRAEPHQPWVFGAGDKDVSEGQFDPVLLKAFQECAPRLDQAFREMPE